MYTDQQFDKLVESVGEQCLRRGWMLVCAESCTGGLLSASLTDIPGSSGWFERGYVTYSNEAKVELLQVGADTLERFGAVSEETAMEMAAGALANTENAHFAVSTTGIAGPGGATSGKPVGMVCFGFAHRAGDGISTQAVTHIFDGNRAQIRQSAVEFALQKLQRFMSQR
ncbi:CinA family protein [Pusillimonas sp. DMV24BSW_D]|uniref:CinA family protein n=1 Tax=Neopusillimonas aestuarii TaxID=2716226 RepID=UPI001407BC90|nr:CinA family protein [Pusillimonas sp. DMV24BSW_D]QIM50244.1 CinA family protein [Pusillimonas sp. DMV24BSW_D]